MSVIDVHSEKPNYGVPRRFAILAFSALFAMVAFLFAMRVGSLKLSLRELLSVLGGSGDATSKLIVISVRLPRNLCAMLVGASLAVSGALLQGVMRNPLAAPNLIGVSSGGGLGAMLVLIAFPKYYALLVPVSFIGAVLATILIYALAWKRGVEPIRLILAGIAVSSLLGACVNSLMILFPERVSGVLDFLVGGLSGRTWKQVHAIWPYALIAIGAGFFLAPRMNILSLGDEVAIGLGLKVEFTRAVALAVSALLAASAVSVAGLLGFVGLIVPHLARLFIGPDFRFLLPASAFLGAGLLTLCDAAGRLILDPVEFPAGIIMAVFGAPFFLFLLRRKSDYGIKG